MFPVSRPLQTRKIVITQIPLKPVLWLRYPPGMIPLFL